MTAIPEAVVARVEGIRDASQRSRVAFLAGTLASLALLCASYNAYFSWYRAFVLDYQRLAGSSQHAVVHGSACAGTADCEGEVARIAHRELLVNWIKSQWVTITPLGIQIGVSDAAIVGSLALLITSVWLFFSVRRENHSIGGLLQDTLLEPTLDDPDIRRYVFHGIQTNLVFATLTKNDAPVSQLPTEAEVHSWRQNPEFGVPMEAATLTPAALIRWSVRLALYLPAIALVTLLVADVLSIVWLDAVFRLPHTPLYARLRDARVSQLAVVGGLMLFAGASSVALFRIALRIEGFERATISLLRDYADRVREIANPPAYSTRNVLLRWLSDFK